MTEASALVTLWQELRERVGARAQETPLARLDGPAGVLEEELRQKIVRCLNMRFEAAEELFAFARSVRDRSVGRKLNLRAAIDVGNLCRVNCHYCPMRRDNLHRVGVEENGYVAYRASSERAFDAIERAYDKGFRELFIQSGEDPRLVPIVHSLVEKVHAARPDFNITLNLGALREIEYDNLWHAGARHYLMKHETANAVLHQRYREESLEYRVGHMIKVRNAGFELGSGVILGLPGQTDEDLADDILFMGRMNLREMVSCSPFTPSEELPADMRAMPPGDFTKTCIFVALLRIFFPRARIPAVSNADSPHIARQDGKSGQAMLIDAGANGVTVNFTPPEWAANYGLYVRGKEKTYLVGLEKAKKVARETGALLALEPSTSTSVEEERRRLECSDIDPPAAHSRAAGNPEPRRSAPGFPPSRGRAQT